MRRPSKQPPVAVPRVVVNDDQKQGPINMQVRGSVDVVSGTEVRGWAFARGRKEPVTVQAVLNHEILGEAVANQHRPDLAAAGLGDGNSGYLIKLFRPIDPLYLPFLVVKLDGGDAELPRAPLLGFAEFFAAQYRSHPAAGRPRSVYGGLWTDRTDAPALLRGKRAVGQMPQAAEAGIFDLIHSGHALLELARPPATPDATAAGVAAVLEDSAVLPLLRAVLEDHPVALRAAAAPAADGFAQPSAHNPSPSPAECLALLLPLAEEVLLDVVRDSHKLPEFTPDGASRWASGSAAEALTLAGANGLLERISVPPGTVAVVGPGTLFHVTGDALFCLVVPARGVPLALAADAGRLEVVRESGVRVFA